MWLAALARISDPPAWLERGIRASFCWKALKRQRLGRDCERILSGWVEEVSLLSPGVKPREPAAQVVTLSRAEPPNPKPTPQRAAAFTRRRPRTALDQLYYETFGTDEVAEDTRARLYAEERAKEGVVVRRGDGRVLGVR